jgi:hypothetical protein
MAGLLKIEAKLGEALGLAMATRAATTIAIELVRGVDEDLAERLERIQDGTIEVEERCSELAGSLESDERAVLERARTTKERGDRLLLGFLTPDSTPLDSLEFLTLAVAGEVALWSTLAQYNVRLENEDLTELIQFAVPAQQRHLQLVLEGVRELAAEDDPEDPA